MTALGARTAPRVVLPATSIRDEHPAWPGDAQDALDAAAAYGWPADISEEEALRRLLALNFEREPT